MGSLRNQRPWIAVFAAATLAFCAESIWNNSAGRFQEQVLTFQTGRPWSPRTNLNADLVMAYGIGRNLPERIESWRQNGYGVSVMTGVAWGQYQDYLNSQYDGKNHWDEAQTESDGTEILHGGNKEIPYIAPGVDYGRYLCVGVKRALDAGAEAIFLEEPEFWARAGWSPSFQREWHAYYGQDWQPPNSSPDAQYRASKLKYFLYRRALSQVFNFVKEYGRQHGRVIPCYVATHSLINYAHWRIVSPESSLIKVGTDGYIAQVWTGTARTPNIYEGRRRERTFEAAYLEYSAMQNLVRASGRRIWYLNDPVEDDPNHSWTDYRMNWESTLAASLLQPEVWRYEIMPWPERVFNGKYPVKDIAPTKSVQQQEQAPIGTGLGGFGRSANVERVGIPESYATELQVVVNALGHMEQAADSIKWLNCGTKGVGVLVSDTMMFQRADPDPSDANLGSFYGLAMPLLKRGFPVEPVQIESAAEPEFLSRYRILLLTYEGQKPPTPEFHSALANWVRNGGALVVVDDDRDPYNAVEEWWNQPPFHYATPREQLFEQLALPKDATGLHRVGRGIVLREAASPAALTYRPDGAERILNVVHFAAQAVHVPWEESNALVLRRGPYIIAAGLDESVPSAKPVVLKGRFLDLFDPELPLLHSVILHANSRMLLLDLDVVNSRAPAVIAAASRIKDEQSSINQLRFHADGVADTQAIACISAARPPSVILIDDKPLEKTRYGYQDGVVRIRYDNSIEGHSIQLQFRGHANEAAASIRQ